ncbi:aldehyde dehydrogenase family protein [Mycolicibacterium thermoresistibile]
MTTTPTLPNGLVPGMDQVFIGGAWRSPSTDARYDVTMPSTETVVASVAAPSRDDADLAVQAARRAFDEGEWPRLSIAQRAEACTRLAEELEKRLDRLNTAWTYESGYPKAHGEMINNGAGRTVWRSAIDTALKLPWEERRTTASSDVIIQRQPVGTVLAILTYNGPVVLMGMKVIPALLAGNAVIIKHAPDSQFTSRIVAEAVEAAGLPTGVVSVIAADNDVSQYLVEHPGIDMIHMTGGMPVAVDIVQRTAPRLARTALELGGKSPAIILDDADLDSVMPTLVPGSFGALGQVCVCLSRILVSAKRYDEVVSRLADEIGKWTVGDPFDPNSDLGPLANERALIRTEQMLARAIEQGARVVSGGRRPPHLDRGFYFEPTLLADVTNDMDIAQQEVFGPIVVVIKYDDVDDAIRIANDSPFGLAASVYAGDRDAALDIARKIHSGGVAINLAGTCLTEPFGGVKQSGWGRECGAEGILEFTDIKQIMLSGTYVDS